MTDKTPVLQLPYILPSQAQKHVTHNEAIRLLDVIVQLSVIARHLASPPVSPAQGARYVVAAGAVGAWSGQSGKIALFENGAWQFFAPMAGWTAWVLSEQVLASYTGTAWVSQADGPFNVGQLGISAVPDATNRLSVNAPATLLNHAGAGHQLKINKAQASDTASLLFQTGFSGRAEMGTAGNDDFAIKVSADGAAFVTGLSIAAGTGQVTLPAAARLGGQAADPIAPANGTIWLNTTTGEVKLRSGGATIVLASGALGVTDGDKGDITVSAGGTAWLIDAGAVDNTKLAAMPSGSFKARLSAGTGAPEDISAADAAGILPNFSSTAKGLAPASGGGTANFLRADGTWAAPSSGTLTGLGISATAAEINRVADLTVPQSGFFLTGDLTWNQAAGATEPLDGRFWESSVTGSGITATRIGTGIDPITGESFADYRIAGTATATQTVSLYRATANRIPVSVGQTWTQSLRVRRIAGAAVPANNGLRLDITEVQLPGTVHFTTSTTAVAPDPETLVSLTRTVGNALTNRMQLGVQVRFEVGTNVDYTLRIQGYQFELAATRGLGRYAHMSPAAARGLLGAARRLISTQTVANVASVDFSSALLWAPSGCYELELDNIVPITANAFAMLRTSTDGGTTFAAGASDYQYASFVATSALTTQVDGTLAASSLPVNTQGISNTASAGGLNGTVRIKGLGAARRPAFACDVLSISQGGTLVREMGGGHRAASAAVNGLRLMMSAGNIASGTISLYEVIR